MAGVELRYWPGDFPKIDVADVVVETFACELPAAYLEAMARRQSRAPRWINLEYLSAESWVDSCHGLASPHPRLPLVKHFFFPGFTRTTGGLLRENGLLAGGTPAIAALPPQDALQISLFLLRHGAPGRIARHLGRGDRPIVCHVPPGKPSNGRWSPSGSGPWQRGQLTVQPMPLPAPGDYDRLLWRCDLNFVRGEDSFVRAQWAARPFVWHIYPQQDAAHLAKLDAFLERYASSLSQSASGSGLRLYFRLEHGGRRARRWPAFG